MNMFKKNGGFTLVELIVVIAILAILAGVAIPVYSGYITKANEAADIAQLDAIKTAALATQALTSTGVQTLYVDADQVHINGTSVTTGAEATTSTFAGGKAIQNTDDFKTYYGITGAYSLELKSCGAAIWNGTKWIFVETAINPTAE